MPRGALLRLLVPALLFGSALLLRREVATLDPSTLRLLDLAPFLLLGSAMLLGAYFNRARLSALALCWLAAYGLIRWQLQGSLNAPPALLTYSLLGTALPASVLLLLVLRDPGLRSRAGQSLVAGLAAAWLAGAWLAATFADDVLALVRIWLPIQPWSGYYLPIPSTALFGAALVAGLALLLRRNREDEAALVAALPFAWATLAFLDLPKISALLFGTSGVALVLSLIKSSHEMVYLDELTGIPGRRAFNDRLAALGGHYVIAMVDVDHFKRFNDTHGHDIGDNVLSMVAQRLAEVRGGGSAYRYGGEEFAIVFASRDGAACHRHLEDVRRSVERYRLTIRDRQGRPDSAEHGRARRGRRRQPRGERTLSVTVSIGMARAAAGATPEDVVKAADAALYRAKRKGRNCVSR
jgi:hypothetical protein